MSRRRWAIAAVLLFIAAVVPFIPRTPEPYAPTPARSESFDAFYARRLALSRRDGVKPGNDERLVRRADRTKVAILYIHGFGASRAEGEAVVDLVAEGLGANVYYLRLPGHGAGPDAHAAASATSYLDVVDEALTRAHDLGDKVVVIGTSTGGLLASWAAARRPADVDALVLASPLFGFRRPLSFLAGTPAGMSFIELVEGPDRDASWTDDPEKRKQPGYDDHWLIHQRWRAFGKLHELWRRCATDETFRAVRAPTLLLYSKTDSVVDPTAMKTAMARFRPNPKSRMLAIEDGNHILLSHYVRTDKATITDAILSFLGDVLRLP